MDYGTGKKKQKVKRDTKTHSKAEVLNVFWNNFSIETDNFLRQYHALASVQALDIIHLFVIKIKT